MGGQEEKPLSFHHGWTLRLEAARDRPTMMMAQREARMEPGRARQNLHRLHRPDPRFHRPVPTADLRAQEQTCPASRAQAEMTAQSWVAPYRNTFQAPPEVRDKPRAGWELPGEVPRVSSVSCRMRGHEARRRHFARSISKVSQDNRSRKSWSVSPTTFAQMAEALTRA